MPTEPDDLPPFELPDWGTEGAPPPPPPPAPEEASEEPMGVDGPVLTTMPLPSAWPVRRLLGVITAEGRADGDLAEATSVAIAAALDRLTDQARRAGADAVAGVRLSTVSRKGTVVAVAYGTAVTVGR